MHEYLHHNKSSQYKELQELLAEQKRTNRLLQTFALVAFGFVVGLLAVQVYAKFFRGW